MLGAFFRVREVEFVDQATGRSTVLRDVRLARSASAMQIVREVATHRHAYTPIETDGGPRYTLGGVLDGRAGTYHVYQARPCR